jgi:hypothetical protein
MVRKLIPALVLATASLALAVPVATGIPGAERDDGDQCKAGKRFFVRVTDGSLSCANAKRVLNKFMDNVYTSNPPCYPGQCRSESPKGWACRLLNPELTEQPGPTAKCERDRDSASAILFFKGEGSGNSTPVGGRAACHTISFENVQYVFFRQNIKCGAAKDMARHLRRSHGDWEPGRFKCSSATNFQTDGSCRHRSESNTLFLWYPEH